MSNISTEVKTQEGSPYTLPSASSKENLSFSPKPQVYTSTAKDVLFSYVQTDSLQRLNEDINSIHEIKLPKFDFFSAAVGLAPTALLGVISNWSDSSSIEFKVNFCFLIFALVVAIICLLARKNQSDIAVINDRLKHIKSDLIRIFKQSNIKADYIEEYDYPFSSAWKKHWY